jgi:hypothetical protein
MKAVAMLTAVVFLAVGIGVGILQPVRERHRMDRPVHGSQPTFLPNLSRPSAVRTKHRGTALRA